MPRKPKLPQPIMQIEKLSTGEVHGLDDEFTGQPIPQPNTKPLLTSVELRAAAKEQARLAQLSVLVDAGLGASVGYARKRELIELVPKGKRKVAEFNGQAVLLPMPAWRRL